ncbi:MAG: RNA polymerase sigma factor (sigma-70 family) [Paraglaciecola sp.]|jgi:RNA polymerase sigma factor (sigma-70 family)
MDKFKRWSDNQLIEALTKGGISREQAVTYLLNTFIHFVPTMVKKVGISKEQALDAFTDTLIDLIEQVVDGKFKGESKLSSYLYKIFYFKSIDLFRKNKTNRIDYGLQLLENPDSMPTADEEMDLKEQMKQLHKYLNKLGEPCKQILIDWGFWGYSMSEIAERIGLLGSVQAKDTKYRCLKKLRQMMG